MGLLSIAVILASCSDDETSIDTSKAIRSGNFLQAADFSNPSELKITHSDDFVEEMFNADENEAVFKYSQPEMGTKSTARSGYSYVNQTTEISLEEPQLVEFEDATYVLEFSFRFTLDDESPEALENAARHIILFFTQNPAIEDPYNDALAFPTIKLGDTGQMPLNRQWQTFRLEYKPDVKSFGKYWNINFKVENISLQNNNEFHIRNIQLVKK